MSSAVLLIAHGSRRQEANDDLVRLAALVRARLPMAIVEIAYLELAEPTIPQGLAACRDRGATDIRMLPYFLSEGAHVTTDLRAAREDFAAANRGVNVTLCPPLGLHPLLVEVVLARLNESALS